MKAQIATEYIVLLSVILFVLIPLLYYSIQESSTTITLNDAKDTVQTLAKTADYVYALGPGTSTVALITIPAGGIGSSVSGKEVTLTLVGYGDVVAASKANLTGNFSYLKGTYEIPVTSLDNGIVRIGS